MMCLAAILLAALVAANPAASPVDEASALARAGKYAEARAQIEPYVTTHPFDQAAVFLLARLDYWQDRPREALGLYQALLTSNPTNGDYLQGAARVLLALDDANQALTMAERARQAALDDREAWKLEIAIVERL